MLAEIYGPKNRFNSRKLAQCQFSKFEFFIFGFSHWFSHLQTSLTLFFFPKDVSSMFMYNFLLNSEALHIVLPLTLQNCFGFLIKIVSSFQILGRQYYLRRLLRIYYLATFMRVTKRVFFSIFATHNSPLLLLLTFFLIQCSMYITFNFFCTIHRFWFLL